MSVTDVRSDAIRSCVAKLANNARAEHIDYTNFLELYSGEDNIRNVDNYKNNVIYGRRGSGKTHLLKALQEKMVESFGEARNFPVYVDLRRIIPILPSDAVSDEARGVLIFKYLAQEISLTLSKNVDLIFGFDPFDCSYNRVRQDKINEIKALFSKLYLAFDGEKFTKLSALTVSEEEVKSVGANGSISLSPSMTLTGSSQVKTAVTKSDNLCISVSEITNVLEDVLEVLDLKRITILIDEWSEVELNVQIHLAEVLKKNLSAIRISMKICAIPNRTNLGVMNPDKKFYGLEDGGDIFAYPLDMRYVFEVNKAQTRGFFNDLLQRHLSSIDKDAISSLLHISGAGKEKLINEFFANVALNEVLIACAGVPRDFINLFLNSYDAFLLESSGVAKRISVRNLRSANMSWYETDKKEQINKHPIERQLLERIVDEVIRKRHSMHFLIPEKYSSNKHIQNLIDFRVLHLRRIGYSHKDHPGVSYNVYSVDYGCYNSININKNSLDVGVLDNLDVKELRDIRRISLEDDFFQSFLLEIGEAFNCPHCSKPIDTKHPAYLKQTLCNNCFDRVDVVAA